MGGPAPQRRARRAVPRGGDVQADATRQTGRPTASPAAEANRRLDALAEQARADGDELAAAVLGRTEQPLATYARFFFRQTTPRLMAAGLAGAAAARLRVGRWSVRDAVVPAVVLGLEPFTEWVIHVHVLHQTPRRWRGRTFDLHAARKHREHHLDPADPYKVFVPLPDLAALAVGATAITVATVPAPPVRLTAAVTSLAMLLTYEWTHYLIHTPYKPRSAAYRSIWRSHRLHHFRNEHYWMGVTTNLGDRVLGTFPEKADVEVSPTAWTLGVEPAA